MPTHFKQLRAAVFGAFLCCSVSPNATCQGVADWKIQTPSNTVQLVSVDQPVPNASRFTFRNVSGKIIVNFLVAVSDEAASDNTITDFDAFTGGGVTAVAPDATLTASFGERNLPADRTLHVLAIVYTDGFSAGSKQQLGNLADEMLGTALETRRDADILSARPEHGISGFEDVLARIGKSPSSLGDPLRSVRGVVLPGIPQLYIETQLNRKISRIGPGVIRTRQAVLTEIKRVESEASAPSAAPRTRQGLQQAQENGLVILAIKYHATSDAQVKCLKAFEDAFNQN